MIKCSSKDCNNSPAYMCVCDIGIENYCQNHSNYHRNDYPNHELHALSQKVDDSSNEYLLKVLKKNKKIISESIMQTQNHIKSLKNWLKRTRSALTEMEGYAYLTDQLIQQLTSNSSSLAEFSKKNFESFLRTQKTSVEKYFKEIYSLPVFPQVSNFDTSSFSPYFKILEKISKPILFSLNPVIQSDPSVYFKPNSDFRSFYFHACYRKENVTVKRINDSFDIENDLVNHEEAMKKHPERMLRIYTRYKDNGKHNIITEMWTHTLWNEIHTRKFEECCWFDESFIVRILKDLLVVFKDEKRFLHFTPNVVHVISHSNYKIWYPQEIKIDTTISETTYLSPDLESYPKAFNNENLTQANHNIFSLGLVVLQISTLVDTSQFYKDSKKKEAEELMMKLSESPLRSVLIGMLLRTLKHRFTFEKALEGLSS